MRIGDRVRFSVDMGGRPFQGSGTVARTGELIFVAISHIESGFEFGDFRRELVGFRPEEISHES